MNSDRVQGVTSPEAWAAFNWYLKQVAETVAWSVTEEHLPARLGSDPLEVRAITGFRIEVSLLPIYGGKTFTIFRETADGGEAQAIAQMAAQLFEATQIALPDALSEARFT